MRFLYSELITKFQDVLETPKELIEETFNKPDNTDVITGKYVSMKYFSDFLFIVIFEIDEINESAKFLNAYKIYPKLLDGINISKMKPLDILKEFMNRYGKAMPKFGSQKFMVERSKNIFFPGVLDIEKYLEAMKNK